MSVLDVGTPADNGLRGPLGDTNWMLELHSVDELAGLQQL